MATAAIAIFAEASEQMMGNHEGGSTSFALTFSPPPTIAGSNTYPVVPAHPQESLWKRRPPRLPDRVTMLAGVVFERGPGG